jgi:acyl dehydratase
MPLSLTIDELRSRTGQEIVSSDWIVIDQHLINAFAEVTSDRQWIHVDAQRAQTESPCGRTVAHGFLTLALMSHLSHQAIDIRGDFHRRINYGLNRVRFPAPVPEGSRIRARFLLQSLAEVEGGYQIVWLATVDVEGSPKPALVAEWVVRLYA